MIVYLLDRTVTGRLLSFTMEGARRSVDEKLQAWLKTAETRDELPVFEDAAEKVMNAYEA